MCRQVRVCTRRVDQGRNGNTGGNQASGEHAGDKDIARLPMQAATFLSGDGYPYRNQTHRASDDMHDYQ